MHRWEDQLVSARVVGRAAAAINSIVVSSSASSRADMTSSSCPTSLCSMFSRFARKACRIVSLPRRSHRWNLVGGLWPLLSDQSMFVPDGLFTPGLGIDPNRSVSLRPRRRLFQAEARHLRSKSPGSRPGDQWRTYERPYPRLSTARQREHSPAITLAFSFFGFLASRLLHGPDGRHRLKSHL